MAELIALPGLGTLTPDMGLVGKRRTSDGRFAEGQAGVQSILATGDGKVEFVGFEDHTLAHVRSAMGYPAYYPVHPVEIHRPIKAVLMDLDGTSVRSERFWMGIIEQTVASLLGDDGFQLADEDTPYVSGHSVSEHLQYCIGKYCPEHTVEGARGTYFGHSRRELQEIAKGRGRIDAFVPAPGLKQFLLEMKSRDVAVGLVSSGLHEKAYPAICAAFKAMDLGRPEDFYDTIITAGYSLSGGSAGTLGELSAKPHPWLYAEAFRVGLGLPFEERCSAIGIEDSGAGVCAIRLAGLPAIGVGGGNIEASGTRALCSAYCENLIDVLDVMG